MSDLDRQASGVPYYEPDYHACPKCGNEMDWEDCWMVDCEEGTYDLYEEDPIFYSPGDRAGCEECGGKGGWWYCPSCERSALQHSGEQKE